MSENVITIDTYWVTTGLSCSEVLELKGKTESLFKKVDRKSIDYYDPFVSNIGLKQTNILASNQVMKKVISESDFIGTSVLKRSIESALILYKNTNKPLYPLPLIGKVDSKKLAKDYGKLKKEFNRVNMNEDLFSNKDFNINENKQFWNDVKNKAKSRKKPYNDKLSDINWTILNSALKNKISLNYDPKMFMKLIYPKIIKKVYSPNKDNYKLVFFANINFISDILRLNKKKISKEQLLTLKHNGVLNIQFKYNVRSNKNSYEYNKTVFPTRDNHDGYELKDDEYYYEYNNDYYPLNYKKISKDLLMNDLLLRCY